MFYQFMCSLQLHYMNACIYKRAYIIWCKTSKCNGILMKDRHTIGSNLMCGRWEQRLILEIRQQPAWSNSHCGRLREESRISVLGSSKTSVFELFRVLCRADRFALKLMQHNRCCCLTHQEAAVFIYLYYLFLISFFFFFKFASRRTRN